MTAEERRNTTPDTAQPTEVLRYLERRDWELWVIALVLLTVFAAGVLVFFYYSATEEHPVGAGAARYLWVVLFGLLGLVVLLNIYLIGKKRALAALMRRTFILQQEQEKEREKGMVDPLTGVYSRRFFEETIPREARRCNRSGRPLSLVLVELDNFDQINKQLGHFVGDEVLRDVAGVLRDSLRTSDFAFRFGGDEFLAALPDTPAEGAAVVAGRLRQRLTARAYLKERLGRPLSVSIGQASYVRGMNLEAVIEEVERAVATARASTAVSSPTPES